MSTEQAEDSAELKAAFAAALRVAAGRAELDQQKLAAASGISAGTINSYWHGRTVPKLTDMPTLARPLGMRGREFYDLIMDEYDRRAARSTAATEAAARDNF